MKERPILFSGAMVRAILAGTKTQTRRWVKPWEPRLVNLRRPVPDDVSYLPDFTCYRSTCPYGQPGDRLWVRETWAPQVDCEASAQRWTLIDQNGPKPLLHFAADQGKRPWVSKWRPSIHMPRWASRITLEITGVRVERLQAISNDDAYDEGAADWAAEIVRDGNKFSSAQRAFRALWESINGAEAWEANPWVWVVEFKRIEGRG